MLRPTLHFLLIGALLFGLDAWLSRDTIEGNGARRPIVITRGHQDAIREEFVRTAGRRPDAAEDAALINAAIEEETLYHEALRLGLDRGDRSIRWRLVQKMAFLGGTEETIGRGDDARLYGDALALGLDRDDVVIRRVLVQKMRLLLKMAAAEPPPDDAALRVYLDAHADEYRQPARASLWHVFVSRERRGEAAAGDARAILVRLKRDEPLPSVAVGLGDPFPLRHRYTAATVQSLGKIFGTAFAEAVMALATGEWSSPIASPYGVHLVRVDAREPATTAAFASVRGQVLQRVLTERGEARLRTRVAELRAVYPVWIEGGTPPAPGAGTAPKTDQF